jgi:hypothetical protein
MQRLSRHAQCAAWRRVIHDGPRCRQRVAASFCLLHRASAAVRPISLALRLLKFNARCRPPFAPICFRNRLLTIRCIATLRTKFRLRFLSLFLICFSASGSSTMMHLTPSPPNAQPSDPIVMRRAERDATGRAWCEYLGEIALRCTGDVVERLERYISLRLARAQTSVE